MIYHLYRDAFSEVYTYRYRLTDSNGKLILAATWLPPGEGIQPPRIFFRDGKSRRIAYLDWESRQWWQGDRFILYLTGNETPILVIEEVWNMVDRLLLKMPRYRLRLPDGNVLEARGNRYSEHFYEIFVLPADKGTWDEEESGTWLGEVVHPPVGPTYILKTISPMLTQAPLLLVALVIVMDMWGLKAANEAF